MSKRLIWTTLFLVPIVWGLGVVRYVLFIATLDRFTSEVFTVAAIACGLGVALLVPLAVRWHRLDPHRARRLHLSARIAATVSLVLIAAVIYLHLTIDHGPGGHYTGWDLGIVTFLTEHAHYVHIVGWAVLTLWLVALHRRWAAPDRDLPG